MAYLCTVQKTDKDMDREQRITLIRIAATAAACVLLHFLPVEGRAELVSYLAVYLLIGYDILARAAGNIVKGHVFDENFLMAVATAGAFALALYEGSGDYLEAIAVMLFYQTGEFFQDHAVARSRRNIAALMDIRPDYANVERDGSLIRVAPDEVAVGDTIVVQPGEKVPIDGIVAEGVSSLDTSAITGESLPREVRPGDEIISGCINLSGALKICTTKAFGESTVSKILELVENSASRKARSENFISSFARIYTPAVCIAALALALIPPLFQILSGSMPSGFATFETWIYRALTFLVISCPCALVVSIPLSFFAGIGGAGRAGVLVKGANILETLSKVKTVVFDKTGTLTLGVFEVSAVHDGSDCDIEADDRRLLEYAALAECASSHPVARSIIKAYGRPLDRRRVTGIEELGGHGVKAVVDGKSVAAGNGKLMRSLGIEPCECSHTGTIVHVAVDGRYEGHIVLGDVVKPHAEEAVAQLHRAGVRQTVMLSGDSSKVARDVAGRLGIDRVYGELLPDGKVARLEKIMSGAGPGEKVAFVGDGINDAPVLTRADVGIAMGALGSDAAIEAADVVLMDDDPMKISKAIRISRKCLGIVWQNIIFALGVKGVCLILGAFGIADMWLAVFADVGVMVLAVLNAVRAMDVRRV